MSLAQNKKAYHDYEVSDKFVSGLQLFGHEVKSIKNGGANIVGGKIIVRGGEAFVIGIKIQPYQKNNISKNYDESRVRKLLLKKSEIKKLYELEETKKIFLIPLSLFERNHLIKLEFAVAKKLNKYSKKNKLKEKDINRNIINETDYFDQKY